MQDRGNFLRLRSLSTKVAQLKMCVSSSLVENGALERVPHQNFGRIFFRQMP